MKFFKIVVILSLVLPLKGMQRLMQVSRFAVPALSQAHGIKKLGIQTHFLHDFAHIKGAYLLGARTPLVGYLSDVEIKNGFDEVLYPRVIARVLHSPQNDSNITSMLQLFFYQNPINQKITVTQYDKGMMKALPPTGIAYLLDNPGQNNDDTFIEQWYQKYAIFQDQINQPFSKASFIKKAKQFLKNFRVMRQTLTQEQVSCILLSVLFKNAYDKKELQEFASCYGITLPKDNYTDNDFREFREKFKEGKDHFSAQELEQFSYLVSQQTQREEHGGYNPELLKVTKIECGYKDNLIRPLCVEESIRTFFNTLLYNAHTGHLDILLLPQKVRASCDKELLKFLEKYKGLERSKDIEKKSSQEWLNLVSERPGVFYYQRKNYELESSLDNVLNLLKNLFGLSEISSYKELGDCLSTDARTIVFLPDDSKNTVIFEIYKKEEDKKEKKVSLVLDFRLGHGTADFANRPTERSTELFGKYVSRVISGRSLSFSPYAFEDLLSQIQNGSDFREILKRNSFVIDAFLLYYVQSISDLLEAGFTLKKNFFNACFETEKNLDIRLSLQREQDFLLDILFSAKGVEFENRALCLRFYQRLLRTGYKPSEDDLFWLPDCLHNSVKF